MWYYGQSGFCLLYLLPKFLRCIFFFSFFLCVRVEGFDSFNLMVLIIFNDADKVFTIVDGANSNTGYFIFTFFLYDTEGSFVCWDYHSGSSGGSLVRWNYRPGNKRGSNIWRNCGFNNSEGSAMVTVKVEEFDETMGRIPTEVPFWDETTI